MENNEANIEQIFEECLELFKKKNHDYNGAFAKRFNKRGLAYCVDKITEKCDRLNALIDSEAMVEDESIEDTITDMINYNAMTLDLLSKSGMETIRFGSIGESVKILQRSLSLVDDGIFWYKTENAVKELQRSNGLVVDGIVGEKTWSVILNSHKTMVLQVETLWQVMPNARKSGRAAQYIDALNSVMSKYKINTPLRIAHFLAQIAHESGELKYNEEIASGAAYEGRKDLGNTQKGDGKRFKGRGLIQLTGRSNYTKFAKETGCDCVNHPELVAKLPWCVETAGWFWHTHDLNTAADADAFITITKRINGGTNGKASREAFLIRAKKALGI